MAIISDEEVAARRAQMQGHAMMGQQQAIGSTSAHDYMKFEARKLALHYAVDMARHNNVSVPDLFATYFALLMGADAETPQPAA